MANSRHGLWGRGFVIFYFGMALLVSVWGFSVAASPLDLATSYRIQGEFLSSATSVLVDGKPVEFKILSDQEIAIPPPPTASSTPTRISVVTPGGSIDFDVMAPKTKQAAISDLLLESVMPKVGPTTGGAMVVIRGKGFRHRDLAITFGGQAASVWHANSDEMMTVTLPPHLPGTVDIQVRSADTFSADLKQAFTFVAAPSISGVTPVAASVVGGTRVRISGSGFAKTGVKVLLGKAEATEVLRAGDGSLEVTTPPYTEGPADVAVINPDGQQCVLTGAFLYVPVPTIHSVLPAR